VDLETGAAVALTVQPADRGDTASMATTLAEAGCTVIELAGQAAHADAVGPVAAVSEVGVERVIADKGYHSKQTLEDLAGVSVRTVIAEPERKRQQWTGQSAAQAAVYANRRRLNTTTAKALMRRRGELVERSFAHLYDTGGMRRVHLRKRDNIAKRALIHAAAFNLSLILRQVLRVGTARQAAELFVALYSAFLRLTQATGTVPAVISPRWPLTRLVRKRNRCRRSLSHKATLSTGC
jgi:transposase